MIRIEVKHMQKDANRSEIEMLKKAGAQEFTMVIVDENAPFPSEIESTETVVLPEIQSMTEYIRHHYEMKITAELEERIHCGKLGVMHEGRLLRNPLSIRSRKRTPSYGQIIGALRNAAFKQN